MEFKFNYSDNNNQFRAGILAENRVTAYYSYQPKFST